MERINNQPLNEMFFSADGQAPTTPTRQGSTVVSPIRQIGAQVDPAQIQRLLTAAQNKAAANSAKSASDAAAPKVEEKALFENVAHQTRMIVGTIAVLLVLSIAAFYFFTKNKPEAQ